MKKDSSTRRRLAGVTLAALLLVPAAALATGSLPGNKYGRMTGGGNFTNKHGVKITHGFEVRCPKAKGPNRLEINWDGGNNFHLTSLETIKCTDSAGWEEGKPEAGFDTYRGWGTGKLNGEDGATIYFKFGDAGEPGDDDYIEIDIYDKDGVRAIAGRGTLIDGGNHQAHAANQPD